jgi:hypothetical protein
MIFKHLSLIFFAQSNKSHLTYWHDLGMCNYRQGFDWWIYLLTTYTQDSELQEITAPLLISTIHKSPQHPLRLFPAYCVFNSRSLVMASNSGDPSASRAHIITVWRISRNWTGSPSLLNLPCRAQLNSLTHQSSTSLHLTALSSAGLGPSLYSLGRTQQKTPPPTAPLLL